MKFLFDCEDEICLPKAYYLVSDIKKFTDVIKEEEVEEIAQNGGANKFKKFLENAMVKHPKETGELFSKLWILEEEEKAPNVFKTFSVLFSNETAVDFFLSVLPSLLQIFREFSLTSK